MNAPLLAKKTKPIVYPESDGEPIAENTLQFRWIMTIQGGLDALYADDPMVFVAGDLLWYPEEGKPEIRQAPDILAAFGRLKGDRGSYKQWEEEGTAPQIVFEILSPGNRPNEMIRKFQFYEKYGVDEYYIYDPDNGILNGWLREGDKLKVIPDMVGWISPRAKIRFDMVDGELRITGPDGRPFVTYLELAAQREQAEREKEKAEREKDKAEREKVKAQRQADQQAQAAEKLRAQLKGLGVEPHA